MRLAYIRTGEEGEGSGERDSGHGPAEHLLPCAAQSLLSVRAHSLACEVGVTWGLGSCPDGRIIGLVAQPQMGRGFSASAPSPQSSWFHV